MSAVFEWQSQGSTLRMLLNAHVPETMIFVATILLALVLLPSFFRSTKRLPPGPRPWPILGNLLQIKGSLADWSTELAKTYGPITTIWFGSTPFIFLTDPEIIHEAMVKQGAVYSDRPRAKSNSVMSENFSTINTASGDAWREARKVLVGDVLNKDVLENYKDTRAEATDYLIKKLKEEAGKNDGIVELRPILRLTILQVMMDLVFGVRANLGDAFLVKLESLCTDLFKIMGPVPGDYVSIFWLSVVRRRKSAKKIVKSIEDVFKPFLEEQRELRRTRRGMTGKYADALLSRQEETLQKGAEGLTDQKIFALCRETLVAGMDTTTQTMEWTMAFLLANPEVYQKAVQEIDEVASNRLVGEADIERMPYLAAVLNESMRLMPPLPLAPPRGPNQAAKLKGYDIPTNANVFFSIDSVAWNPKIWTDPLAFRPERFLELGGSNQKFASIAFGAGRRICPGMDLGKLHIRLFTARLLQTFEWSPVKSPEFEFERQLRGPVSVPVKPLRASIKIRNES